MLKLGKRDVRVVTKTMHFPEPLDAPIVRTYVGILELGYPCISVNPVRSETVIRRYSLKYPGGLMGKVYSGVGNTILVVEESKSFEFVFDVNAPRDFVKSAVTKAYSAVKGHVKSYLLFGYAPVGSWINPVSVCKQEVPREVYSIPPPQDIDKCAPRQVGDTLECVNQSGIGYMAVAVSPVYVYVILGYGLVLLSRRGAIE